MGRYWGGGCLGAVIIGCVFYGIQLGWGWVFCGLVCLTFSGFSSGLLFSVGGFFFVCYVLPLGSLFRISRKFVN